MAKAPIRSDEWFALVSQVENGMPASYMESSSIYFPKIYISYISEVGLSKCRCSFKNVRNCPTSLLQVGLLFMGYAKVRPTSIRHRKEFRPNCI